MNGHPLASTSSGWPGQYTPSPVSLTGNDPSPTADHLQQTNAAKTAIARPKKRKSSVMSKDDSDDDDKKPKAALSCSECKRRKIKCDRKMPCSTCLKRGDPQGCSFDQAKIEPERQPFALVSDLKRLAERLGIIEKWMQTLPEEMRPSTSTLGQPFLTTFDYLLASEEPRTSSTTTNAYATAFGPGKNTAGRARQGRDSKNDEDDTLGVMEEAARHLETSAFSNESYNARFAEKTKKASEVPLADSHHPAIYSRFLHYGIDQHREPNETGTTIVAARPLFYIEESIPYPVHLVTSAGIDPQDNMEDTIAARTNSFLKLCSYLPNKEFADVLVSYHFERSSWVFNIIHRPSFEAELRQFWKMRDQGRLLEIDPTWLSLYCLMLAAAVDVLPEDVRKPFLEPNERPGDKGGRWILCSQRFSELGDTLEAPSIRAIQRIILETQLSNFVFGQSRGSRVLVKLATAVRMAQMMGLHQLGSHADTMPAWEDPALPPGKNSVKREYALRLWNALVFIDWLTAASRTASYCVNPAHNNSAFPSNLNDGDLSVDKWQIPYRPLSELTDGSYEHMRMLFANSARLAFDRLMVASTSFQYETIIELDRAFRQPLEIMPDLWKDEKKANEIASLRQRMTGYMFKQSVHSRIFRLHRPFMIRGYRGGRFKFSLEKCLESAQQAIMAHGYMLEGGLALWFCYSNTLGAAICLFADFFHSIDTGANEVELAQKRQFLNLAVNIFEEGRSKAALWIRPMVSRSFLILQRLAAAVEERRMNRAARTLVGNKDQSEEQSFAKILEDTTLRMASATPLPEANSRGLGPEAVAPNPNGSPPKPAQPAIPAMTPLLGPDPSLAINAQDAQFYADLGLVVDLDNQMPDSVQQNFWAGRADAGANQTSSSGNTPTDADQVNTDWLNQLLQQGGQPGTANPNASMLFGMSW